MRDKIKRVLAVVMVILLLSMYIWSFAAALTARPEAHSVFMAAILTTIFFPVLLFIYIRTAELLRGKGVDQEQEETYKEKKIREGNRKN